MYANNLDPFESFCRISAVDSITAVFFIKTCLISLCVCLILTMSHPGEKEIQPTTSEAGRKTHLGVTSSSKIASGKNRHFNQGATTRWASKKPL